MVCVTSFKTYCQDFKQILKLHEEFYPYRSLSLKKMKLDYQFELSPENFADEENCHCTRPNVPSQALTCFKGTRESDVSN